MVHDVALAVWFLLPAGWANMAPVLTASVPGLRRLNAPIDGGLRFRGRPLLGSHKTWRGLASGILVATLVLWLQQLAVVHFGWAKTLASPLPYESLPTLILGALFGLGALGGDAIKSFFKRQLGYESGASWLPFDQLDFVIGGILVSLPFVNLGLKEYAVALLVWFGLHIATTVTAWWLGLKQKPI